MRCPHCGYNSFAHLPRCKKCGGELYEVTAQTCTFEDRSVAKETPSAEVCPQEVTFTEAELRAAPEVDVESSSAPASAQVSLARFASALSPDELLLLWGLEDTPATGMGIDSPTVGRSSSMVVRRFIASVVDLAAILGVWLLFYTLTYKLLWGAQPQFFAPLLSNPHVRGGFYLLFVLIALGYFNIFHYATGQTPGKILTHVRVVSVHDEPLSLAQVLLRTCGGFVSALCLGCGYMAIWFSASKRGWNDLLADTEVISSVEPEIED